MKISYGQVEEYCNELHGLASSIKTLLEDVKTSGTTVSKTECWSGEAATYFIKKISTLAANFDEFCEEIEYSILFMANASSGYQAVDKNVMKEICENLHITEPNLMSSKVFH